MKNFLSLVLFLFLFATIPSFAQEPSTQLNQEGCGIYASVVSRMFLGLQENPKAQVEELFKIVTPESEEAYKDTPEDIKELVKLSAQLLIHEGPNYQVDEVYENVKSFCFRHRGNVETMIKGLKKVLKITEI